MAERVMGTETEFGVTDAANAQANPIVLSATAVETYAQHVSNGTVVRWDYTGEDPLNDARGYRLSRANAHPSLLTDDPYRLAPSGGVDFENQPSEYEQYMQRATSVVLPNGGRFYVDHAHPEYSSPETTDALQAVLYDRAGDRIAQRAMQAAQADGCNLVLYKNNTDGKGAAYGTHENYQVSREVDLDDIISVLTPFFITRPIMCGSGRVGIGQHSQRPGFQISQRADFIENDVGLETTFNRPIINTRDEPHADGNEFRRLHVINADANQFDVSTFLRMGTTALILRCLEQDRALAWDGLMLDQDPVATAWAVSHDLEFAGRIDTQSGQSLSAIDLQRAYRDLVIDTLDDLTDVDERVLHLWEQVLDGLQNNRAEVAHLVEWVGKYELLERQRQRLGTGWENPRLSAMDIQWADLRPERSLVERLAQAGRVERLVSDHAIEKATHAPPENTRAYVRGQAIQRLGTVVKASWTSIVVNDAASGQLCRIPLPDPADSSLKYGIGMIEQGDTSALIHHMKTIEKENS
ncbi:MAG: depupylase/deamidase Dop [Actinomycetaceae bacterium]|nr:depupylase/deamidase Dop [Actinomycetaceae bacterium]